MLQSVLDFLLPAVCLSCERLLPPGDGLVCEVCWHQVGVLPSPRCGRCGHPTLADCHWCRLLPESVSFARSWCWADHRVGQRLLHALKYEGWWRVAEGMARRMSRLSIPGGSSAPHVLVPVPLAPDRQRERGFNQSERLARGLAHAWRFPLASDLLSRTRATETQTRLTPAERLVNVSNAFHADAERVRSLGDTVLVLVDDVITTGATLNACTAALLEAGARTIGYITFGRARDPRDAGP